MSLRIGFLLAPLAFFLISNFPAAEAQDSSDDSNDIRQLCYDSICWDRYMENLDLATEKYNACLVNVDELCKTVSNEYCLKRRQECEDTFAEDKAAATYTHRSCLLKCYTVPIQELKKAFGEITQYL